MSILQQVFSNAWHLLVDSSAYVVFGVLVGGLIKVLLSPGFVARHLGGGRFSSVVKASLLGVPLPLCSCAVLPMAASLKRQGASNGATTAFLISTPESGMDSMAVSYALLDPIMTVARPIAGAVSAIAAGITENLWHKKGKVPPPAPDLSCQVDACCDGTNCPPYEHAHHHGLGEKLRAGVRFAFTELWGDLAGWFLVGLLLAGVVTTLVPEDFMAAHLGGGIGAMLVMLLVGIPIYICATASTPIAAALILQGVSPGAVLVFLLTGPATNITSLAVVIRILGRRGTMIYLTVIALFAVLFGLAVDALYALLAISPQSTVGQAAEMIPYPAQLASAAVLLLFSVKPVYRTVGSWFGKGDGHGHGHGHGRHPQEDGCDCR